MTNIIIFGASKNGLKIKRALEELGILASYTFCDNNIKKQGCTLDGSNIISIEELEKLDKEGKCDEIILSMLQPDDVIKQLRQIGIRAKVMWGGRWLELLWENCKLQESIMAYLCLVDIKKPRLSYFEYHISHHCNLKCKGCGHFSNIAQPEFGNLDRYVRDIKRLKELYWGVGVIRLMGGEPLLNKELPLFLKQTREIFPDADIRVVTNGLLIPAIDRRVLAAMKQYYIKFDITQYPPTQELKEKIELLCAENDIAFFISSLVEKFFDSYNPKGDCDKWKSYQYCDSKNCHFLQDGKLSVCALPILYEKHRDLLQHKMEIQENNFINIYEENLDGFSLNAFLEKPIDMCRYCDNINKKWFVWQGNYPYKER